MACVPFLPGVHEKDDAGKGKNRTGRQKGENSMKCEVCEKDTTQFYSTHEQGFKMCRKCILMLYRQETRCHNCGKKKILYERGAHFYCEECFLEKSRI